MKAKTHPKYFPKAKVTCNCGNSFEVGATIESIRVEVCSACHPFYTGKQNLVDTAGRVDKFKARAKKAEELKSSTAAKDKAGKQASTKKAVKKQKQTDKDKLKEMRKQLSRD